MTAPSPPHGQRKITASLPEGIEAEEAHSVIAGLSAAHTEGVRIVADHG